MNNLTLQQILQSPYDLAKWQDVLREVFGATRVLQNPDDRLTIRLTDKDRELASRAAELGSLETSDGRIVGLYQVDLTDKPRIWQNRVGLRSLLRSVYKHDVDAALVVFVPPDKSKWRLSLISEIRVLEDGDWVNFKTGTKRYTYLLGKGETVRTATDQVHSFTESTKDLDSLIKAFSVEKVNKDFFREYKVVFDAVLAEAKAQLTDDEKARLFTQRLLNRLMFLYFIQKKGWMKFDGDENYLRAIFEKAKASRENFFENRLYWVFFHGLGKHAAQQNEVDETFLEERRGTVEYLNGGLFEREPDGTDAQGAVELSNDRFEEILRLFENYNFTIDESTPFEVQVAVDPEMLGKVFEELVTGRHESGSYYTPRTVVSFMCREALKHALSGTDTPDAIAKLVDENEGRYVRKPESILKRLGDLKVCDPACGSGAYLLGMLHELLHVREALFAAENIAPDAQYNWKREIIENSIYGVDLDRFATQIASLRLWLSLAIESDDPHPLPNLKYKIGCGDSLLAPIETVGQGDLHRRALIEQFRARKREYTDADDHIKKREIDDEIERLRIEIARTLHHLPEPPSDAKLFAARNGVEDWKAKITDAIGRGDKYNAEKHQKSLNSLLGQIAQWEAERTVDHYDTGDIFDWSVEFAEVFEDGGFDVVLANPPYVRQEDIKPKEYKDKLVSLYSEAMTGKSDLFVAFYSRALQLLKDGGTHVFVCSNSWLDVGYGGKLQGYLLNNSHVAAIYDSAIERQFASADINTIISFIHKQEPNDDDVTRFISLRAPFNEAILDDTKCRIVTKTSAEIWESGSNENNRYEGDKWGGKYLRAPDIYFTIIEKGRDRLTKLGALSRFRRGVTTGANDFFYISPSDQAKWNIESEFLVPIIKSPRECRSIHVPSDTLQLNLFVCHKDKNLLRGTNALSYIEDFGEKDDLWLDDESGEYNPPYNRPTCRTRSNWYDVGFQKPPEFVMFKGYNERFFVVANPDRLAVGDRLYCIGLSNEYEDQLDRITVSLNSTVTHLFTELGGRVNLGEGALDIMTYEAANTLVMLPQYIDSIPAFDWSRTILPVVEEITQPDRRELDNIIFDALGLTTGERDAVYEAVIDLVSKRLQRAQTVTT